MNSNRIQNIDKVLHTFAVEPQRLREALWSPVDLSIIGSSRWLKALLEAGAAKAVEDRTDPVFDC